MLLAGSQAVLGEAESRVPQKSPGEEVGAASGHHQQGAGALDTESALHEKERGCGGKA